MSGPVEGGPALAFECSNADYHAWVTWTLSTVRRATSGVKVSATEEPDDTETHLSRQKQSLWEEMLVHGAGKTRGSCWYRSLVSMATFLCSSHQYNTPSGSSKRYFHSEGGSGSWATPLWQDTPRWALMAHLVRWSRLRGVLVHTANMESKKSSWRWSSKEVMSNVFWNHCKDWSC